MYCCSQGNRLFSWNPIPPPFRQCYTELTKSASLPGSGNWKVLVFSTHCNVTFEQSFSTAFSGCMQQCMCMLRIARACLELRVRVQN